MAFCKFSSQSVIEGKTEVDNIFINDYLPYASDNAVKVYLYGLYKCSNASAYDNTLESFSKVLNLPEEDILEIFKYWEEQGLVQILNVVPIEIRYVPVKSVLTNVKKFKESKYTDFNLAIQEIITGRMINPNEYTEYYSVLESLHIEPEALLMIVKYCVNLKGDNVGYKYILTVAKNWAYENIKTVKDVENRLISYEQYSDELKQLLKLLGIKRYAYVEEKDLFIKWTKKLEFNIETIIFAAKKHKKASKTLNFEKLDDILTKYYENNLMSENEIEEYEKRFESLYELSKQVVKSLGLFYADLQPVIDGYILPWKSMGFEDATIVNISKFCFLSGVRTLEQMNINVKKFFKLGLISFNAIEEYLHNISNEENKIVEILNALSLTRAVTNWDRSMYRIWVKDWQMPDELIKHATTLAQGKSYAMEYMNKILSKWHENKIETLEEAKKVVFETVKTAPKIKTERSYSEKEIENLFNTLEEVEI